MGLEEPPLCKSPRPHAAASASHLFLLCVRAEDRSERCGLQAGFRLLDGWSGTPASSVMSEVRPSGEEKCVGRLQKQPTCGATDLGFAQFSPLVNS